MSEYQTLGEVINDIEITLPGWGWLVRSDGKGRYFANVTSPDFLPLMRPEGYTSFLGKKFPAYDTDEIEALADAYLAAKAEAG